MKWISSSRLLAGLLLSSLCLSCNSSVENQKTLDLKNYYQEKLLPLSPVLNKAQIQELRYLAGLDGASALLDEGVKFTDIQRWERLGHRYVLGYGTQDGEETPLAVYDLAYANPFSGHFPRTLLGSVGFGSINLAQLIDLLKKIVSRENESDSQEVAEALAQIDLLSTGLSDDKKDEVISFPKDFWRHLKWKDGKQRIQAPEVIVLSDIDWQIMSQSQRDYSRQMTEINQLMARYFEEEGDFNFLAELSLRRHPDSQEYDIYFGHETAKKKIGYGKPLKIADFKKPEKSYAKGIQLYLIQTAIKTLVGLIPEPVSNRVLSIVVSRWFQLFKLQLKSHFMAARHFLNTAEANDPESPFANLSHESRIKIGNYLINHKTGALSIIKHLFANKKKAWEYKIAGEAQDIRKSEVWMRNKGWEWDPMGPAFASRNESNLFLMLIPHWLWSKRPETAIDLDHPNKKLWLRNGIELFGLAFKFVELPIPFAEEVIKFLFDELVRDEDKTARQHEYALSAYLQAREIERCENWQHALKLLHRNRLNPFELESSQENFLVEERMEAMGLELSLSLSHCR